MEFTVFYAIIYNNKITAICQATYCKLQNLKFSTAYLERSIFTKWQNQSVKTNESFF